MFFNTMGETPAAPFSARLGDFGKYVVKGSRRACQTQAVERQSVVSYAQPTL